jgi:hypothetical protein
MTKISAIELTNALLADVEVIANEELSSSVRSLVEELNVCARPSRASRARKCSALVARACMQATRETAEFLRKLKVRRLNSTYLTVSSVANADACCAQILVPKGKMTAAVRGIVEQKSKRVRHGF